MRKKLLILIAAGTVAVFALVLFADKADAPEQSIRDTSADTEQEKPTNKQDVAFDKSKFSITDQDSLWLVANKKRPISTEYVPADLVGLNIAKRQDKTAEELMLRQEAAVALETLFAAAFNEDINLLLGSAYRSADLQATYYNSYVKTYGQEEADKFSAKPGTSEHQIGLSADISTVDQTCYLEICFAETVEGKWLATNAHDYGFVIRYLEGKESITGYQYEPWHIRYVGKELAAEVFESKQTLEEFFEIN